ncbi:MAG: DUF4397 domain-containing protein [Gemmatimonadaceae bacterium]
MTKFKSIAVLMGIMALASCEKNGVQDITGVTPDAKIRFFNFALNAPSVNFFANDTKVTAILSSAGTPVSTGVVYGGVAAGGLYSGVAAGTYQFSAQISDTNIKNVTVAKVSQAIVAGKTYSFFTSGLYDATTRTSDGFIVEDNYPTTFDYTQALVRFVNAIYNSTPMTLYAKNQVTGVETAIGGAIAYKSAGAFVGLPNGVYDLSTRVTGSTTNVIVRTAVGFAQGSVYTIGARGDITIVSTTATNRPFLDNTANR